MLLLLRQTENWLDGPNDTSTMSAFPRAPRAFRSVFGIPFGLDGDFNGNKNKISYLSFHYKSAN